MTSYALVDVPSLNLLRGVIAQKFEAALRGVGRYEWRYVPKGAILWEYGDKPSLLADQDYVEIHAFGGIHDLA